MKQDEYIWIYLHYEASKATWKTISEVHVNAECVHTAIKTQLGQNMA